MNQPADTNNHLSGLTYDAAGNVKNDGLGGAFVFDGENRITTAGSVTYTYDADGRRIQKSTGINYWYGPGGQALAETDSSGTWTNYVFFGGRRLARNISGDIKYYITDHLNSTAMFVDKAGTTAAILDDNDMYPWGGVVPGVGKTTSNNTIKFTGQYRDTDTGANLDYFGARYYSNTVGRFMSPDWAAKPTTVPYAKFGDPQSLNLYSYVENGPINRVDADGHSYAGMNGFHADTTGSSNAEAMEMGTAVSSVPSPPVDANTLGLMLFTVGVLPLQGPSPTPPPSNPCAGVSPSQFDYSRIGNDGKTIRQHIEKGHMVLLSNGRGYTLPLAGSKEEGNGQYRFTPQGPTPDANFEAVQEINAITFLMGTFKNQGGYTVYERSLTSAELYSISRPLGQKQVSFFVGDAQPSGWKPGMGPFLVPTPTNRFVVNSTTCQPVTSYPIIQ